MKIYICPECGQFREASRRKEVICYRCENEVQMQPIKLSMEEYFNMTKEERENPTILNASRRKRIAAGSGQSVTKINQLVKRYDEARKMMKSFMKPGGNSRMNRMFRGF